MWDEQSKKNLKESKEILKYDPDNCDALFNLALGELQENNLDDAMQKFIKLTKLDPNNADAYGFLAYIFIENKDPELAT